MRADGEGMKEVKESHRGMVDGCRWRGSGMGDRAASVWCLCQRLVCMSDET
jgi:hypothetical protein